MAISALIYEDNELLRESLCSMFSLTSEINVAGAFNSPANFKDHLQKYRPDLILMDIDMPEMDGIEAVKKIRSINRNVAIIMLTVFDDDRHVFDAICVGASGYLLKKHISSKLYDSVREVLDGGAPMSPSIARMVISSMQQPQQPANDYQLTPREKEVLALLARGNSYKLIAARFEISIDTVRTHIKRIYEKLHVHSQTEAVSKAINERLV